MDALLIPTFFCPKAWERMSGDETTRFCSYCKKNVHNLAAMSVRDRLALLSSPTASICARYRIAIRRPRQGCEESYMRHMLKYGAGTAVSGAAMLVLWQVRAECEDRTFYRAVAGVHRALTDPDSWPEEYYEHHEVVALGMMISSGPVICDPPVGEADPAPAHVDLDLDPAEIDRLLKSAETPPPVAAVTPTGN